MFAYGQTGSGKSYSMVGYGANKGIVPITCETLFQRVELSTDVKLKAKKTKIQKIFNIFFFSLNKERISNYIFYAWNL